MKGGFAACQAIVSTGRYRFAQHRGGADSRAMQMTVGRGAAHKTAQLNRRMWCLGALAGWPNFGQAEDKAVVRVAFSEQLDPAFVTSLVALIASEAKLRLAPESVPLARLLMLVEQGQALGFGLSTSDERRRSLLFSRQVFRSSVWAVGRPGVDVRDLSSLRGRVVCKSRMADYGSQLDVQATTGLDIRHVDGDLEQRLKTLEGRHCDVLLVAGRSLSDSSIRARLIAAGGDPDKLSISRRPLAEQAAHLAVARASPLVDYLPQIDAAILKCADRIQALIALRT